MYPRRNRQEKLTPGECVRGAALSVLYLFVFPFAMAWVQRTTGEELPVAEANVVYYLISVMLVFLLFWRFLKRNFELLLDRLPENLFALLVGLAGAELFRALVTLLPCPVENPNVYNYREQFLLSPGATTVILVVLMPIVEEMIFRGFLFGTVRRCSRGLAYVLSAGLFALYSVWQFVFSYGTVDLRYLLLFAQYVPMSLALCWSYDNGGSVWTPVALHMVLNAAALFHAIR